MLSSCTECVQCVFDGMSFFSFSYGFLFVNLHSEHPVAASSVSSDDCSRVKQASMGVERGGKGDVYHTLYGHTCIFECGINFWWSAPRKG
jgi:hypothetical protein